MKRLAAAAAMAIGMVTLMGGPASAAKVNTNDPAYWSSVTGYTCVKTEFPAGSDVKAVTADGSYALVLVKGGSVATPDGPGIARYEWVSAGDTLAAPSNAGGQQAAISWIITCQGGYEPYSS